MKEKIANTALGELLLLIARDERIYRAMARLGETEVPFVLTGAIASLQRFLDEYGTPENESKQQARSSILRKPPVSTTVYTGTRPIEQGVAREPLPVFPKADILPPPIVSPGIPEPKPAPLSATLQASIPAVVPPSAPKPEAQVSVPPPAGRVERIPPPARLEVAPPAMGPETPPRPPLPPKVEVSQAVTASARIAVPEQGAIPEVAPAPKVGVQKSMPQVRIPFAFEDQPSYVHAVSLIPLSDSPSPTPFLLEEPGLDQRCSIFAVDHAGMRFFLSELNPDSFNVSKNGMLLLNKQDSLRLRGVHERIVNRVRQYGSVLPAEFGSAVLGRDDLARRVEFRLHALLEFVLDLGKTPTWRVTASVLDERVQRLLGPETPPQRSARQEVERGRQGTSARRIDVKGLERILTQEMKIAESVLSNLASLAESHSVEQIVNLGSGRSEDWKAILTATFALSPGQNPRFFKAVLDVEEEQSMAELMVRVTGTTESFSLLM